jgi:hypothetical protein
MWTHWPLNWFFLSNAIFKFFHQNISLKNQYLPHLSSENCEINSIQSDSSRAFQQHQECPQISIQFSFFILFYLHWKIGSIINSFQTVAPNNLKPSQCTLAHEELSHTKNATWSRVVWEISLWQNKTNYLAS